MTVLTVCGSLRAKSSNLALLEAYEFLAPPDVKVERFRDLALLPHFNPDLDIDPLPSAVYEMREAMHRADVVVFSTPEYIHALPGALKNLLEWIVSDPRFYEKPVVILQTNHRSTFAQASLIEVLQTMSAKMIEGASAVIPLPSNSVSPDQIVSHPEWSRTLSASLSAVMRYGDKIKPSI